MKCPLKIRYLYILAVLAGCDRLSPIAGFQRPHPGSPPGLITEADRQFHFGTVISRPGRKLDHRYHLVNATSRDVTITEVINRKTCCGVVRIGKQHLHPGEATDLEVTLVVGEKFGAVVHETELVTDLPGSLSLVFRTSAIGEPALRVEEISPSIGCMILGSGEARRPEFRTLAAGTATEKPFDLARAELVSTVPPNGPARRRRVPGMPGWSKVAGSSPRSTRRGRRAIAGRRS